MNVGSLFSGIGGLDLGLHRAGFRHVFFCESDEYRRAVLRERFPGVPVYDDVRDVGRERSAGAQTESVGEPDVGRRETWTGLSVRPDLVCGGFPCQDLSVAGRRKGLAGDRSGLFFEFARIIGALRPRYVLLENVPGLLSSNDGRDFGVVLGTLADLGYGLGYRILDSRYFGVPQRRRRVFIVGIRADGDPRAAAERAGEILAVGTRCDWHPTQGFKEGPEVSGTLGGGAGERGWRQGVQEAMQGQLVSQALTKGQRLGDGSQETFVAAPLSHGSNPNSNPAGRRREDDENLVAFSHTQGIDAQPSESVWPTLRSEGGGQAVMQGGSQQDAFSEPSGIASTLAFSSGTHQGHHQPKLLDGAMVRRLTPTECERLQSLPDGWTDLGGTADSKRYAALGDAVTANVAEWIGRRILGG